jgi:hypothetical protein
MIYTDYKIVPMYSLYYLYAFVKLYNNKFELTNAYNTSINGITIVIAINKFRLFIIIIWVILYFCKNPMNRESPPEDGNALLSLDAIIQSKEPTLERNITQQSVVY